MLNHERKENSLSAAIGKKNECEFVCDVTDFNSLFITNEIIWGRDDGWERGRGLLFLATPLSRVYTNMLHGLFLNDKC